MVEEEKKDEEQEEEKKTDFVSEIEALKKGLDESTTTAKEVLEQQKELYSRMTLGGKSDAGEQPPEQKEETPAEYRNRILRGE